MHMYELPALLKLLHSKQIFKQIQSLSTNSLVQITPMMLYVIYSLLCNCSVCLFERRTPLLCFTADAQKQVFRDFLRRTSTDPNEILHASSDQQKTFPGKIWRGSAVGRCHGNPERVSFFVSISCTLSTT